MPSNAAAVVLVITGVATAALFAADHILDVQRQWLAGYRLLPVRRRRADTPAKLFHNDPDLQRRLGAVTG